jgi:hypothetical protein
MFRDKLMRHLATLRTAMYVADTCESALMHQSSNGDQKMVAMLRTYCGEKIYISMQERCRWLPFSTTRES